LDGVGNKISDEHCIRDAGTKREQRYDKLNEHAKSFNEKKMTLLLEQRWWQLID
jgi:hypothetical protein